MRNVLDTRSSLLMSLVLGGLIAVASCTTSDDPGTATGTGGKAGTGGTPGSGGTQGSGGAGSGGAGTGGAGTGGAGTGGAVVDARPDTGPADMGSDTVAGAATFTELWDTIFSLPMTAANVSSCAGAQCHNPGREDNISMSTKAMAYTTLRTKVTPGNPGASTLVTRLTTNNAMQVMPKGRTKLSAALVDRVRSWIMAGAMNN